MTTIQMNPQIMEAHIGVRKLEAITIYPLSMADQFKMSDIITTAVLHLANLADNTDDSSTADTAFVHALFQILKDNILVLLAYVLDKEEIEKVTLDKLTNTQLSEIVTIIFEVNYEPILKNFQSLRQKLRTSGKVETPAVSIEQ